MKTRHWIIALALTALTFEAHAAEPANAAPANRPSPIVFKAKDYSHLLGMEGFPDELLTLHFKLYEGYVKNSNLLNERLRALSSEGKDKTPDYAALKRIYGWEYDGMRLHEYYFDNLGGQESLQENAPLYQAIVKAFGSYDNWKKDFIATGLIRGIGWAVLYYDPQSQQLVNTWINEHDLGHLAGNKPILIMDVFEHAYMPKYGLDRAAYIDAFFKNINWPVVASRYPTSTP